MADRLVTVFGGSGFIGRYIVRHLAAKGVRVRVAVRDTEKAQFLKPAGDLGQISTMPVSVTDPDGVRRAVDGADWVINLVGILYERGSRSFEKIHVEGARTVAKAAAEAGASRLLHLSALGADAASKSKYARSKAAGEAAVLEAFPTATIFRPSVIFGQEDRFFNLFGELARVSPVLPFFTHVVPHAENGGGPKFQPVYVGDVADAAIAVLSREDSASGVYELTGPVIYDMREIMQTVVKYTDRRPYICGLPFWLAKIEAFFLQFLPKPLLTPDQVKLLETDNVASGQHPGLTELGVAPTTVESVVPAYLRRFRPYLQQKRLRFKTR